MTSFIPSRPQTVPILQDENLTSLIHPGHPSGLGSVSSNEQEKDSDSSKSMEEWKDSCSMPFTALSSHSDEVPEDGSHTDVRADLFQGQ